MSNLSQGVSDSQSRNLHYLRSNISAQFQKQFKQLRNAEFSKNSLARSHEESIQSVLRCQAQQHTLYGGQASLVYSDLQATQSFSDSLSNTPNQIKPKRFTETYLMIFTICSRRCSCLNLSSAGITGLCPHLDLHLLLFSVN